MFLPDVLLHRAGLHFLGAVGARELLCVAVHSLPVIVQTAGELEGDTTLITVHGFVLVSFHPTPSFNDVINVILLLHCSKIGKLIKMVLARLATGNLNGYMERVVLNLSL